MFFSKYILLHDVAWRVLILLACHRTCICTTYFVLSASHSGMPFSTVDVFCCTNRKVDHDRLSLLTRSPVPCRTCFPC